MGGRGIAGDLSRGAVARLPILTLFLALTYLTQCPMNESKEARDRADLMWSSRFAFGEANCDLTIEATEEGLETDLGPVIPWSWILRARSRIEQQQS